MANTDTDNTPADSTLADDTLADEVMDEAAIDPADQAPGSMVDDMLDELLPEGIEWRRLVNTYPKTALATAVVGGFILGRNKGTGLLAAATGFITGEVSRNVQSFLSDIEQ